VRSFQAVEGQPGHHITEGQPRRPGLNRPLDEEQERPREEERPRDAVSARHASGPLALRVIDAYPYGIVVLSGDGRVIAHNPAADRLMGEIAERLDDPDDRTFCAILGRGSEATALDEVSLIEHALEAGPLPEVRVDLPPGATAPAAWVTVAPLGDGGDCVIVELRPGRANDRRRRTTPHWTRGPVLRIYALGRTRIETPEGPLHGQWLENRAGQVLKFLVAERGRAVSADEIVETLWEDARLRKVPGVRYYIHQLREQLEPERSGRGQSSFISSVQGGYTLNDESVVVDVDEFERRVETGLAAARAKDADRACTELHRGLAFYEGDFLADEPYAEWALPERDRLRRVASEGLRVLAELRLDSDDLTGATADLERLADLEPYDPDVHKRLIALSLRRGRRTEAVRRYNALRRRMIATFGEDLDFTLADIAAG
jgi:DNA-binding SARP family transcriptional activator